MGQWDNLRGVDNSLDPGWPCESVRLCTRVRTVPVRKWQFMVTVHPSLALINTQLVVCKLED